MNLTGVAGPLGVEWMNPAKGAKTTGRERRFDTNLYSCDETMFRSSHSSTWTTLAAEWSGRLATEETKVVVPG